jgi:adenosylcobinamide-GDP ribazoletransferase
MTRAVQALRLACGFLTIVPIAPRDRPATDAELADSRYAFPVVGLAIGLVLLFLSDALGRALAPPLVAAFVLVAVGEAISGALHLDGLADTFDGLFLAGTFERRLTAMRDPHLGTFGASALALVLLGKFAAVASLATHNRGLALLAAAAISRTLILVSAGSARYARLEGTGRAVVASTNSNDAIGAALAACAVGLAAAHMPGLIAAAVAVGMAWAVTQFASTRLGGITGDTLGALVELGELIVLLALSLLELNWAK